MIKKLIKNLIVITLLSIISALMGCQKRAEINDGWKGGRYDFATNLNWVELDKICYDLGTSSTRKLLQVGWGKNAQSLDGHSYVQAKQEASIIELPPMTSTPRVLTIRAFPFLTTGAVSASVAIYLNGHFIKRIKLLSGWKSYSVPIKGENFSLKNNILLFEHKFKYSTSKTAYRQNNKKPSVAYDRLYFIKEELADSQEKLSDNFINLKQKKIRGDTRNVLETKANTKFEYTIPLTSPTELHFSLGLLEKEAAKLEDATFQIFIKNSKIGEKLLFSKKYSSEIKQLAKNWHDFKVDLSPFTDTTISLTFKTQITAKKNFKSSTICWGNPYLLTSQGEENRKPNIILYLVDTLRADHVGCYGNPLIKTSNIDTLASEGILFEKAFAQASWTKPSTASLLTSTYPSFHGAITREDALTETIITLAENLKNNGYVTAAFTNQPNISADYGFYQGFDSYVETYHQIRRSPLYSKHMNTLIMPWLEENSDKPIFLYIHTIDPHDPYTPPPPFDTMYDKDYTGSIDGSVETIKKIVGGKLKFNQRDINHLEALYNGEVTLNDSSFGEVIEQLKKLKLYDQTLIIFTSDHGEEFYEHKGFKHGLTLYEEQIHIPLIMSLPSHLPANMRISPMVRLIDIMPTILELLNLSIPTQCQGESLLPLIQREKEFLIEDMFSEEDLDGAVLQSVRGKQWKLISYPKTNSLELFNLNNDPKELTNLLNQYPELAKTLMEKISSWHQEQVELRVGLRRPEVKKLSEETIKQLKALGYIN